MLEISQDEHKKVSTTFLVEPSLVWFKGYGFKLIKLDDDLTQFVKFLESLSKLIENGKPIGGTYKICQPD